MKKIVLFVLAITMLFCCSCQNTPEPPSDGEITEQPEPQRMAYHLSNVARLENDIYFPCGVSFTKSNVYASEYDAADFEIYVPCFDTVCDHRNRKICCLATTAIGGRTEQIAAFLYKGEPALLIFNPVDICLSRPYSNVKTTLLCEDYLNASDVWAAYDEWKTSPTKPRRSELFVYRDYLYYVETRSGVRTQYRISLEGGEPERVFEEDNVIIRTIINDRLYGIRYDVNDWTPEEDVLPTRDQIHYFRSDMNYQNVEPLHEKLEFFSLLSDDITNGLIILEADEEFIYAKRGTKIFAFSDSDMNAEPILLSDMEGKIPSDLPSPSPTYWGYNDGTVYTIINTGLYTRSTLDYGGMSNKTQWFESSTLYSIDIRTGECKELDISNQNYLIHEILYADDKYIYALGRYVHDDNRAEQGVTMRLTLDTMRYEVILPDRFWEYSAKTAS